MPSVESARPSRARRLRVCQARRGVDGALVVALVTPSALRPEGWLTSNFLASYAPSTPALCSCPLERAESERARARERSDRVGELMASEEPTVDKPRRGEPREPPPRAPAVEEMAVPDHSKPTTESEDDPWRPASLHLAAAACSCSCVDAADAVQVRGLLVGGWVMVLLQCVTVLAVLLGTSLPRCAVNSHCSSIDGGLEWFCTGGDAEILVNRCVLCSGAPLAHPVAGPPPQLDEKTGLVLNDPYDERFAGRYNLSAVRGYCRRATTELAQNWCSGCVRLGDTPPVKLTTEADIRKHHVWAMGVSDWAALCLCTALVALGVSHELHDIDLCNFVLTATESLLDHGPRTTGSTEETRAFASRPAVLLLNFVRRWVFLPAIVATVPFLVVMKGGDATNVCFNSVGTWRRSSCDSVYDYCSLVYGSIPRGSSEHPCMQASSDVGLDLMYRSDSVYCRDEPHHVQLGPGQGCAVRHTRESVLPAVRVGAGAVVSQQTCARCARDA